MVVSLRDSDDSDSDVDNGSSSQMAFGGLEFMIKEARRTAEVGPADCRRCRQTTEGGTHSEGSGASDPDLELLFSCAVLEVILWYFSGSKTESRISV